MLMMMTCHLAGHAHRWWTPIDFTGLLLAALDLEPKPDTRALRPQESQVQRAENWPRRLTEQMFSPPPSLRANPHDHQK